MIRGGIFIIGVLVFLSTPSIQDVLFLYVMFLLNLYDKSISKPFNEELIDLYSQTGNAPLIVCSTPAGSITI